MKKIYEICEKAELGNDHGRTYPAKNLIKIRTDEYEGVINGNGRDRFTILHEIAHLFLHDSETVSYARNEDVKTCEDPEWQAVN